MSYEVIEGAHDSHRLQLSPIQVWVIASLEVCIREGGREYLLLDYPSYPLLGGGHEQTHDEGYWCIPFAAFPVPLQFSGPTTMGSLKQLTAHIDQTRTRDAVAQLAYHMGLQDTDIAYRGEFFELKHSPRSPGLIKAFKIVRYGLRGLAESSFRNLADPDSRYGYVFMPLDNRDAITSSRYSELHLRDELWYLGKPLMSDVEYVLAGASRLSQLRAEAIDLDSKLFFREEFGILIAADLAGYGKALAYSRKHLRTFQEDGRKAEEGLRRSVGRAFEGLLSQLGATQVQAAGDGFVASLPARVSPDFRSKLRTVMQLWDEVVDEVARLNVSIADPEHMVGSRLALHIGHYSYGRIGGASSFSASFDGSAIVEVARIEQGLAAGLASGAIAPSDPRIVGGPRHHVAASGDLIALVGDEWMKELPYVSLGEIPLIAKEYSASAYVWEWADNVS